MGKAKPAAVIETLADLTPDPRNARRHNPRNVGMLEKALGEVGAARSIVIDEHGVVLAGNATIEAAARAGIEKVQVVDADGETIIAVRRTGLTAAQKTRLALYDNRTAELADWDADVIADLMANERAMLDGLFADDELAELIDDLGEPDTTDAEPQIDRAAELNKKWQVQAGDLWRVGEHRLLCGDSTKREDVDRLMLVAKTAMLTDPPYGLNVTKKASVAPGLNFKDQAWDVEAPSGDVLTQLLRQSEQAIVWGGNCMALPVEPRWLAWDKQTDGMTFAEMELAWTNTKGVPRMFRLRPQNMDGGKQHPTQKPLQLIAWCISFLESQTIFDPFLGSGTTMVACENLKRKCRGIEISPDYCAVILERMATAFPALAIERA